MKHHSTTVEGSDHWHDVRLARVGLSTVLDPRDITGQLVIKALGPVKAWNVISGTSGVNSKQQQALEDAVVSHGKSLSGVSGYSLAKAAQRWAVRAAVADPARDWARARRQGFWVCIPEDSDWPQALDDLQETAPVCLWGRGNREVLGQIQHSVAVVGSRDCSAYGRAVTFDIAGALASRGWTVLSGGAFGVDAAAHQAALATGSGALPTVAVMAGGVDRLYPKGNQELLHQIVQRGLVLSESPPGTVPARFRFLDRNRLIAALSKATVVTESRWRSGAQSTAHHAAGLSRVVAAVPGSVQSATSAGCHRLIKEATAVLVTDISDVMELITPLDELGCLDVPGTETQQLTLRDSLSESDRRLMDVFPSVRGVSVDFLACAAGLPVSQVLGGLRRLERMGLVVDRDGTWFKQS